MSGYRKKLPMTRSYVRYDNIGRIFGGVFSATSGIMLSYNISDKETVIPLSEPKLNLIDSNFGFGEFNAVNEYEPDDEFRMTISRQELPIYHEILKIYAKQSFYEYGVYEEINGHMDFLLKNDIFPGVISDSKHKDILSFFMKAIFLKI